MITRSLADYSQKLESLLKKASYREFKEHGDEAKTHMEENLSTLRNSLLDCVKLETVMQAEGPCDKLVEIQKIKAEMQLYITSIEKKLKNQKQLDNLGKFLGYR